MKTKTFATAIVLFLTMPVLAQFVFIEHSYEVALIDVRLPSNDSGTIAFKPCSDCDYEVRRLAADARWEINGKAMTLSQFRLRTASINARNKVPVTVSRHIESDRVIRVSLTLRTPA